MPTPVKEFLYTVVRIETKNMDGSTGSGTSFVVKDISSPAEHQLFLVSNKHVVSDAVSGIVYLAELGDDGRPILGKPFFLNNDGFASQWHGHPDDNVDVAVMPLSWQLSMLDLKAFVRPVQSEEIASENVFENLDVSAPILFVGFPNGMYDEKHYLPIVRRGYVATSPNLDFNGEPFFLIDASVFPGSSGSPVFTVGENIIGGTPALKLLGIISAVYTQSTDGSISWRPAPTNQVPIPTIKQMIDLGVVYKVKCIQETINDFWQTRPKAI
jgi:Trypsin-like peptidase domain